VVELREVPANTIKPNPWNWRLHPEAQRDALAEIVDDIGFAGALIARETPDGLELVDGHLRQDLFGDSLVPVLIVDMTEAEVRRLLATLDPIGAMAQTDTEALRALLNTLDISGEATLLMLDNLLEVVEGEEFEPPADTLEDIIADLPIPTGEDSKQSPDGMVVVSLRMPHATWERLRPQVLGFQSEGVLVDVV